MRRLARALVRRLPSSRSRSERRHLLVGPTHLWKMKRDFQIGFLESQGLEPRDRLLDLGCGTLRGGIPLIEYLEPGHYTGIEPRAEVLEEARRELAEAGLEARQPELYAGDASSLSLDGKFDYVWAFSVLIHLDDEILDGTVRFVSEHVTPDGVFFANVNVGDRVEGVWQGFPVVWRSVAFYQEACARHGLALRDLGPLRELGHVSGIDSQDAQRMLEIRPA